LLELKPDLQSMDLVASSRRRPAKHELDSLWAIRQVQQGGLDGKLALVATNRLWLYDVGDGSLTGSPGLPSLAANYSPAVFSWSDGWLLSLMGQSMMPRHLLAYSEGDTNFTSMLQQRPENNGRRMGPALAKGFPTPTWDWPEDFPLENALLAVEKRALWALNPRRFLNDPFPRQPDEPLSFTDDRNATLFRFETEIRQPIALSVRFEVNPQTIDPFIASEAGFASFGWNQPNLSTWVATPQGLVLAVPKAIGHWLIPQVTLEGKLGAQRESLRAENKSKTVPTPSPAAPAASNSAPIKL
jgi:hypothetical protein